MCHWNKTVHPVYQQLQMCALFSPDFTSFCLIYLLNVFVSFYPILPRFTPFFLLLVYMFYSERFYNRSFFYFPLKFLQRRKREALTVTALPLTQFLIWQCNSSGSFFGICPTQTRAQPGVSDIPDCVDDWTMVYPPFYFCPIEGFEMKNSSILLQGIPVIMFPPTEFSIRVIVFPEPSSPTLNFS